MYEIIVLATVNRVVTKTSKNAVVAKIAIDDIATRAAGVINTVIPLAAVNRVVTGTSCTAIVNYIVTLIAIDEIVAGHAIQSIVTAKTFHSIGVWCSSNIVGAGGSSKIHGYLP